MIKEIQITGCPKRNWIDQNNVVFGYDWDWLCCERFGCGIYDAETKELVGRELDGMVFHFDFEKGAIEIEVNGTAIGTEEDGGRLCEASPDTVTVELIADDGSGKRLIAEFYNIHNGYYYHDFSFKKEDR